MIQSVVVVWLIIVVTFEFQGRFRLTTIGAHRNLFWGGFSLQDDGFLTHPEGLSEDILPKFWTSMRGWLPNFGDIPKAYFWMGIWRTLRPRWILRPPGAISVHNAVWQHETMNLSSPVRSPKFNRPDHRGQVKRKCALLLIINFITNSNDSLSNDSYQSSLVWHYKRIKSINIIHNAS